MTHPLEGARLKLVRAGKHLEDLDREVVEYLEAADHPVTLTSRSGRVNNHRVSRIVVVVNRHPPDDLAVIVGDWANNVRSAIDYVVYELARMASGVADPDGTSFPIVTRVDRWERASDSIRLLRPEHQDFIDRLQPYHDDRPDEHPLAVLQLLSNRDKHRLLHTTVAQINEAGAKISGAQAIYDLRHLTGPVPDEGDLLYLEYEAESEDDVRIQGNISVDVALEDGRPLRQTLFAVADYVGDVVEWFAPVFPNGH